MNSNELNNYINSLNEFGNNELKVKLENFYLFNKPVISFFKGIDSQFQSLMSAKSIDENVVNDIIDSKEILNALTNAKRELFSFDEIVLSESVKNKLLKNYDYIVNTMVLNEALIMLQKFYTLLSENELALKNEKEELENLRKKKIEDDRKKKEEEKRKEVLRLAEIELKKQEEKRKLKELEEKRKQDEIRIKQEKERLEKERIEAVERKELEVKRKEELRLAEIELKRKEEIRKQKELEEQRRQEEILLKQEKDNIEIERIQIEGMEHRLKFDYFNTWYPYIVEKLATNNNSLAFFNNEENDVIDDKYRSGMAHDPICHSIVTISYSQSSLPINNIITINQKKIEIIRGIKRTLFGGEKVIIKNKIVNNYKYEYNILELVFNFGSLYDSINGIELYGAIAKNVNISTHLKSEFALNYLEKYFDFNKEIGRVYSKSKNKFL